MPARKRATKPIEIALTEEQIEGIIAEAASRAGRTSASWGRSPEDLPVSADGAGAQGFPVVAGASLPGDSLFREFSPLAEASFPRVPGPQAPPDPSSAESTSAAEIEEHRRNVNRQLRGREQA